MRNFNRILLFVSGIISFFNAGGLIWANAAKGNANSLTLPAVLWIIAGIGFLYIAYRSWRKDNVNDKSP